MNLFKIGFLENRLSWLYFAVGIVLAYLGALERTDQESVVGVVLTVFMLEFIRFMKNRIDLDIDDRKEYLLKATANWFAALFGAIITVLVV